MSVANVCIVVTVGLPASGKSAACRALLAASAVRTDVRVEHVEFDAHLSDWSFDNDDSDDGHAAGAWKAARARLAESVETRVVAAESDEALLVLLVDDNMYYESMRRPYWHMARAHGAAFAILECDSGDLDACLRRNALRDEGTGRRVPDDVVRRMAARLEPPTASEAPFVVRLAYFTAGSVTEAEAGALLGELVRRAASPPVSLRQEAERAAAVELQRDADRALVRESRRHRRELLLRALVGALVREAPADQRAAEARRLAERKRVVAADAALADVDDAAWQAQARAMLTDSPRCGSGSAETRS